MWPIAYLGLTLLAVGATFRVSGNSRPLAIILGLGVLANWLLIQWTYASFAPQVTLRAAGFPIGARDLWAFFDGILGLVAVYCLSRSRTFWPAWGIVSLVVAQELLHEMRGRGLPLEQYLGWLDGTYLAMLAVLIAAGLTEGGNGVGDSDNGVRRFRRLRSS